MPRARNRRFGRGVRLLAAAFGVAVSPAASGTLRAQAASPAFSDSAHASVPAAHPSAGERPRDIEAAARRHAAAVRHCYEENGLKEDPVLRGLLRVAMTVLPDGGVRGATVTATRVHGLGMSLVTACVSSSARSWRFGEGAARAERVVLWFDVLPADP